MIGSVQEEAIYEARPGESVAEMLAAAGGPNTLGDPSRFILYRSGSSDAPGPQEIPIASASRTDVRPGDIVQIDLQARTLDVKLSAEEIEQRLAALPKFESRITSKWLKRYSYFVTSADTGAVLQS